MSDQSNLCYIIDYQRSYYRLDNNNQLVVAENKDQASVFRPEEANEKIRTGRKAQFYSTVPVDETLVLTYDPGQVDWVTYLEQFCGLVNALDKYQAELKEGLSDVDMKICDILHYVELYETEGKSRELVQLLHECRKERRMIKDAMFCADTFQKTLGTKDNLVKARDTLKQICRLDNRKYTPRKLGELFEGARKAQTYWEEAMPEQETQESERKMEQEIFVEDKEDKSMEYVKRETVFDGQENDWRAFARQQVAFYGNINQYITNRYIRMEELDALIESLLEETEDANYNVTQGYRVFKMLKEFRRERKAIKTELQYLEPMAKCFDCPAMEEAYRYSLDVMDEVLGVEEGEETGNAGSEG